VARSENCDDRLVAACISARVGELQLAAAATLARENPQSAASLAQFVDAARQNFDPSANVSAGLGTNSTSNA
jgi:hypothetical protein